jgi:short-subunit dehydrogenase
MAEPFLDCTALITGASSGLGGEFARQLARRARTLILVARRLDRLEALRSELARPGLTIECHAVDLGDPHALEKLLRELQARAGQIDLIVNNAGLGDHGFFDESEWSRVESMIDVNITALTRLTHGLLPQLIRARRGVILNVSSIASFLPVPRMAVYSATKAYVTSFSEALRAELRRTGVTVTALCPGPVDTEFFTTAERPSSDGRMETPGWLKVSAEQVVREALVAAGDDRPRIVPGWIVWIIMAVAALLPLFILRPFFAQRRP